MVRHITNILIPFLLFMNFAFSAGVEEAERLDRANSQEFVQFLDDTHEFLLSTQVRIKEMKLHGSLVRHRLHALQINERAPYAIVSGVEVRINGLPLHVESKSASFSGNDIEYNAWSADLKPAGPSIVELFFYGKRMGEYKFDPITSQLTRTTAPQHLSAFDIRQFYLKGKSHALEWTQNSPSASTNKGSLSRVDLHTHFGGALTSEAIVRTAFAAEAPYPTKLLDEMHINYLKEAVFQKNNESYIQLSKKNLIFNGKDRLQQLFSISLDATVSFQTMEDIYRWRGPLVKNVDLFEGFLRELVHDYKSRGVLYAELSLSDILKPEWRAVAHRVLPDLEKSTGVKINFLVGLWRHSDVNYNNSVIDKILLVKDPYIVGVDFMGEETNSTKEFGQEIQRLASYRQQTNSKFQIRVHAGENRNFPDNVKDAIKFGATRIGHGVYGIDQETIDLAKNREVIIELNTNSNLALRNISGREHLPAREYLDAGVRLTLGTDGHGLYNTSPESELSVLRGMGITTRDLKKITKSDEKYLRELESPSQPVTRSTSDSKRSTEKKGLNSSQRLCREIFTR